MKATENPDPNAARDRWNAVRDVPERAKGHCESYSVRANHPERALALWIRHTIVRPADGRTPASGELWAIWFDGETEEIVAARETMPLSRCAFSGDRLGAQIGHAVLNDNVLYGTSRQDSRELSWELSMHGGQPPTLLLPRHLYDRSVPLAMSVTPRPNLTLSGNILLNGRRVDIEGWTGSQSHDWGSRHVDQYISGQVCGFDNAPSAFLECCSARARIGPLRLPRMTSAVLRFEDKEYRSVGLRRSINATSSFSYFDWTLDTLGTDFSLSAHFVAPRYRFAGLAYPNPPGGLKPCLNAKLATCNATLRRSGQADVTLTTDHRASFDILTDDDEHRVARLI